MSVNEDWDIEQYHDDYENEEHWQLRRMFMQRWKSECPENRLVTLSKIFSNVEFLGSQYSPDLMHEVAKMSEEIAKDYRAAKKERIQRTFVSASDAAVDRARGTKREGDAIASQTPQKLSKINFVKSGEGSSQDYKEDPGAEAKDEPCCSTSKAVQPTGKAATSDVQQTDTATSDKEIAGSSKDVATVPLVVTEPEKIDYEAEMLEVNCVPVTNIADFMFSTKFGRLVLLVRSWAGKIWNIQSSCQVCGIKFEYHYDKATNVCSVVIDGKTVAQGSGNTKKMGKKAVEDQAWQILKHEAITVLVKEQFISQDDSRISFADVSGAPGRGPRDDEFGAPVEPTVAAKMMKMMGWRGGGLGADSQGICEPVKPHLQMVNRAGLGSVSCDIRQIKSAAISLMQRYIASDCLDLDLIFSSDFSKEERAALHIVAKKAQLISKSYGQGNERFLVVKKKINPFDLVRAVVQKGGVTQKYQVYVPAKVAAFYRERE